METCPECECHLPEFVDSYCPECGADLVETEGEFAERVRRETENRTVEKNNKQSCEEAVETEKQPSSENENHVGLDDVVKKSLRGIVIITTLGICIVVAVTLHQKRLRETYQQQWEAQIKHGGKGSRPGESATLEGYEPVAWHEVPTISDQNHLWIHVYRQNKYSKLQYMEVMTHDDRMLDFEHLSEEEAKRILRRE